MSKNKKPFTLFKLIKMIEKIIKISEDTLIILIKSGEEI